MSDISCDILIVGGGAAGLCAGITAKRADKNARVVVIERLSKCGKKLLATGNGRCNLSNLNISPEHYHGSVDVKPLLDKSALVAVFFSSLGILTYADNEGRIYPLSNSAATVNDALIAQAEESGVKIVCDFEITDIKKNEKGFEIISDADTVFAKKVILSAGGCAQKNLGSNGSGFSIAKKLGLKVNEPVPVICPVPVKKTELNGLSGLRAKAIATIITDGNAVKSEAGEVQFAEKYLSGICIFNLARLAVPERSVVSLNLLPDFNRNEIISTVNSAAEKFRNRTLDWLLSGIFNRKLAIYLVKKAVKKPLDAKISALTKTELENVAKTISDLRFTVTERASFDSAQAVLGGIAGSEITACLESKKHKGLFFAGEILDTVGDCGGFNLHFAWLSGLISGRAAAERNKR